MPSLQYEAGYEAGRRDALNDWQGETYRRLAMLAGAQNLDEEFKRAQRLLYEFVRYFPDSRAASAGTGTTAEAV